MYINITQQPTQLQKKKKEEGKFHFKFLKRQWLKTKSKVTHILYPEV